MRSLTTQSPSRTAFDVRAERRLCTELPDVSFVLLSASRIGPPRPRSVRVERKRMFVSTSCLTVTTLSATRSQPNLRKGISLSALSMSTTDIGINRRRDQGLKTNLETSMRICVIGGSALPRSAGILSNSGTILTILNTRMSTVSSTTAIGGRSAPLPDDL